MRASHHARAWLDSIPTRPVGPRLSADHLAAVLGGPLPHGPTPAEDVIDLLAGGADTGLMAMQSGRFYGWVIGGTLPAALAADWLVSAWDQNTGLRYASPATAALEEVAAGWLLDLLGLPTSADVGFVTGGMMANFTCLGAGRSAVLSRVGWDVARHGLIGGPRIRVLAGEERHDTIDVALRYLGLGEAELVGVDDQGRIRVDRLTEALESGSDSPTIVCLQAGNVHSGAFDPLRAAIEVAHRHGAWVHVDGAFGLWAGVSPRLRHLVDGMEAADSWATDAHKTLNVPYDCGIAIVADRAALRSAFGVEGSYLIPDETGKGDPMDRVPEFSRRARGVPVWAALRSLGRTGVADLVERLVRHAQALAGGIGSIDGARVLNSVDYTQICVAFGDDAQTRAVTARLIADGAVWMSGSRWHDQDVLRISVSNWSTDDEDVRQSLEAIRAAVPASDAARV
ncbi:MAG: aspartate aminotransferase family protein [Candidatus Dormibacteraeota bacterium]|nr:aspartate aminotransferase family protein [Candidatus Dormibacteraeota bacterium]